MKNAAIKVEGLSKKYDIVHKKRNQDDTLLRTFTGGIKNLFGASARVEKEEFWALRDISFTLQPGERVGIIGRNGAGKSTLLKILSRVVKPTGGQIEYFGRMASLLEVGTGFHGDLTGRENIYLNGTIMGMSRKEIDRKFDEIVAFSEIGQFLDTPVKRYSSGMYVRLAFSIAAHLDNDILIVDEVLAVGDAAFQEKCIGKIHEGQEQGKTVLFVSHNIGQISAVCTRGICLEKGKLVFDGPVDKAIDHYLKRNAGYSGFALGFPETETAFSVVEISLSDKDKKPGRDFKHNEEYHITVKVKCATAINDVLLGILILDVQGKRITSLQIPVSGKLKQGEYKTFSAVMPGNVLTPNEYLISVALHIPNVEIFDEKHNVLSFRIVDNGSEFYKYSGDVGYLFPPNKWVY